MHTPLPITTPSSRGHRPPPFRVSRFAFRVSYPAFTLIELMVVVGIIVVLAAVTLPAVKSLTKNNGNAQATNLIRSYLATARSIAISQHRQAGVVFFEETPTNAPAYHGGQTALQLMVEDPLQYVRPLVSPYTAAPAPGNTVFIYYSKERQYLPAGMQVATLNYGSASNTNIFSNAQNTTSGAQSRCVIFDANGQMIVRNGVASLASVGGTGDAGYPKAYADWNLSTPAAANTIAVSSPGLVIFNANDFANANLTTDSARDTWLQQHADLIIVNAYTGGVIR